MTEINLSKIRKNLIVLYEAFLKNPTNKKVQYIIREYDKEYGGLPSYENLSVKKIVPNELISAISGLSTIYQYGLWDESHKTFSKTQILETARKILEKLKKN